MRFLQRLRLSPLSPGFVTFLVLVLSGLGHPVDSSGGEARPRPANDSSSRAFDRSSSNIAIPATRTRSRRADCGWTR